MRRGRGLFPERSGGGWWNHQGRRLAFDGAARLAYPRLTWSAKGTHLEYQIRVPVPQYGYRELRIEVRGRTLPSDVWVYADAPGDSLHRYPDGALCMWYPPDPPERRWLPSDGLVTLIDLAIAHLFREAWWRETGYWSGEEAPHDVPKKVQKSG